MSGIIYKNSDALAVLRDVKGKSFDLIYIDVPQNTQEQGWFYSPVVERPFSIRTDLAKKRGCKPQDISMEEVRTVREEYDTRNAKKSFEHYKGYITTILQSCVSVLKNDGVLCFECQIVEEAGTNFRMALEYCFESVEHVILEQRSVVIPERDNNKIIYFCSKQKGFRLPIIYELPPEDRYREHDERGAYALISLDRNYSGMTVYDYEWHGLKPRHSWRYNKMKMDELYADDRIIIKKNFAYLKQYREEHLVPVKSPWPGITMDITGNKGYNCPKYIDNIMKMFIKDDSRVLCLYDYCARFALAFDQHNLDWISLYMPSGNNFDKLSYIPKEHYIVRELPRLDHETYRTDIIASVSELKELQQKASSMMNAIKTIQATLNIETDDEEDIESVLTEICDEIEKTCYGQINEEAVNEAKRWINPFWDKLEKESQVFLPTGVVLQTVFADLSDVERSLYILEYCKTLEKELLNKIFKRYILDLYSRKINVRSAFKNDFENQITKPFVHFVEKSIQHINNPDNWKFEMGKMTYTLENVLVKKIHSPIYDDFNNFLPRILKDPFFKAEFMADMEKVRSLRNESAHHIINDTVQIEINKNIIQSKLITLLKYYKK